MKGEIEKKYQFSKRAKKIKRISIGFDMKNKK
jgi:hypothetical protein